MIYILLIHPVVAVLRVIKVLRFCAVLRHWQRSVDIETFGCALSVIISIQCAYLCHVSIEHLLVYYCTL
jgi:hypothetical protein